MVIVKGYLYLKECNVVLITMHRELVEPTQS